MKFKKYIGLMVMVVCVVGGSVYVWDNISDEMNSRKSVLENARPVKDDNVVVYSDGEYTATISKEEYDTLPESTKANFDNTYKKIIEIIEKNE